MKLTKAEREKVRVMFGGRCAYCGSELGERWHADHVEPIRRDFHYVRGKGFVPNGKCDYPERHRLDNMMPACPPCNIDKHSLSLEHWRQKLQDACGVLARNSSTYRFARSYGLLIETGSSVLFYFERVAGNLEARTE